MNWTHMKSRNGQTMSNDCHQWYLMTFQSVVVLPIVLRQFARWIVRAGYVFLRSLLSMNYNEIKNGACECHVLFIIYFKNVFVTVNLSEVDRDEHRPDR